VATTAAPTPGTLSDDQLLDLEQWASSLERRGGSDELVHLGGVLVGLTGEARRLRGDWEWRDTPGKPPSLAELEGHVAHARPLHGAGSPELEAAARATLLLCEEIRLALGYPPFPQPSDPPADQPARRQSVTLPIFAAVPALVLVVAYLLLRAVAPEVSSGGVPPGGLVGGEALPGLKLWIEGPAGPLTDATWRIDGKDVTVAVEVLGGRAVLRPGALADGRHELTVDFGGILPWSPADVSMSFVVDVAPPEIELAGDVLQAVPRRPFSLGGRLLGGTGLQIDGRPVPIADGVFSVDLAQPPAEPITLIAHDAAGNEAIRVVTVVLVPREPANPMRAVHVTAAAWANAELRAGVLALIDDGRINAVELDLKDESGVIGWDAPVPLAIEIGAVRPLFDLAEAVQDLHGRGVRVVGRLVAFRDPILAEAAWRAGDRAQVVQTPGRKPYSGGYGGFTNFANPIVRQYNIDVAAAAAAAGVDDILYDYVRRPDGPLESMRFPGLQGDAADAIVSFLAETRVALAGTEAFLGASVFGIAATRPEEIAQDIPRMARELDYVAPMLYPDHWGPGEYGLANPETQPYEIVLASLADFQSAVAGTGARIVPWLQDFSLGVPYGPHEVRAQIRAVGDAGLGEYLLWDPAVTYTAKGLDRNAKLPTFGEREIQTGAPVAQLPANELGVVPVLMFHQVLLDGGGEFDVTPDGLRAQLDRLYREGYRPIRASDLVKGTIDVPAGTTPVVLTFDDAASNQLSLDVDGNPEPDTAVGILLEFARLHPGFEPAATFYVNRNPFAAGEGAAELASWLKEHGFELGNHTRDHANLASLSSKQVQRQLVLGNRLIHELLPGEEVVTMALPLGMLPLDPQLAVRGSWDGDEYAFAGVMLVGAEPSPSPFSTAFDLARIPRIRATADPTVQNGLADWLARLARKPGSRYVSDGNPDRITVEAGRESEVIEALRARVVAR
jgi:peptidoglycan/xylan/chitin deacetylase (PgdA/CDA1 family)